MNGQEAGSRRSRMRPVSQLSYGVLLTAAFLVGLAPFWPEPHLLEKLALLSRGELTRPLDILDLVFHGSPIGILAFRALSDLARRPPRN